MDNSNLIKQMLLSGFLSSERIAQAFKEIDRKDFVGTENKPATYQDRPLPIGSGQTISQPSTVAFMLEKLDPKSGNKILDIGSGSGWTTALLGYLVGPKGRVIGLERIPELVEFGRNNLAKYNLKNTAILKAKEEIGHPHEGPFDRILVSAESDYLPIELIDQLKAGGRLVLPIQGAIEVVSKEVDGSINQESYPGFVFVPLV
jgi:protein-L-isoaspartate(D-aspartate) O-methyltransferase